MKDVGVCYYIKQNGRDYVVHCRQIPEPQTVILGDGHPMVNVIRRQLQNELSNMWAVVLLEEKVHQVIYTRTHMGEDGFEPSIKWAVKFLNDHLVDLTFLQQKSKASQQ